MKWRTHTFKQTDTDTRLIISKNVRWRPFGKSGRCKKCVLHFPLQFLFDIFHSFRGIFTLKLMKLTLQGPFQGPGNGLSNVFIWSYFFIKFAKARYFYHSRLSIIEICQAVISYNFFLNFMFMVFAAF